MKETGSLCLAIIILVLVAAEGMALSPPQYDLQRKAAQVLGADPCVTVSEVYEGQGFFIITVTACNEGIASSLSLVLKQWWDFGGLSTIVRVLNPDGSAANVPQLQDGEDPARFLAFHFSRAFFSNPYFVRAIALPGGLFEPAVGVEIAPQVVQYWNDNIGDLYGNTNLVAADAFASLCRERFFGGLVSAMWTTSLIAIPVPADQ